ncbi:eCIS core domain-containing protein [Streptomyces sp. NPDC054796]
MRDQETVGQREAGPGRTPVRKPSEGSGAPPSAGLLALQRTAGNAAVVRMLRRAGLTEAPTPHDHGPHADEESVQRSAVHDVLRRSGRPLDADTRTDMETRIGADFSDVRIHDDATARASAAEIGARAYTSGSHIVIGDGGGDKHTLAHELTHVVQQRSGPVAGTDNGSGLKVSDPSDRFEREAEANATRVMRAPARESASSPTADVERTPAPDSATDFVQRTLNHTAAPTRAERASRVDNRGRAVESEILTDGSLAGSPVSQDPPGYDYIRSLNLTSTWVRFHLVNQKAGGEGTRDNLVTASGSDNQVYERTIESVLKNDVNQAKNNPGSYVYFATRVAYNRTAPATAGIAQQNSVYAFPSSLDITHKLYDPAAGWTAGTHDNTTFTFQTPQPADTRTPMAIASLDLPTLYQYTGFAPRTKVWDQQDVGFLKSVATGGSRHQAFVTAVQGFGGTLAEQVDAAFWEFPFSPPRANARGTGTQGATSFGSRVTGHNDGFEALDALCATIGAGLLTL